MSLNYDPNWPKERPTLDLAQVKSPWWVFPPRGKYIKSLDHHALTYVPESKDLEFFERLGRQDRLLVLARLRRLEAEVNLKPLSIPLALLSATGIYVGIGMRGLTGDPGALAIAVVGALAFLALFGILVLPVIRSHNRKEACLTAWTEAFKDSHSHQTKLEEEGRRQAYERTRRQREKR